MERAAEGAKILGLKSEFNAAISQLPQPVRLRDLRGLSARHGFGGAVGKGQKNIQGYFLADKAWVSFWSGFRFWRRYFRESVTWPIPVKFMLTASAFFVAISFFIAETRFGVFEFARTACAAVVAAEWRWLPSLRGGHLASCAGRWTELEHLHSEPRLRDGAALGECEARAVVKAASAARPTILREAAYFCVCGADRRARGTFDNPGGRNALPTFELDGCLVARAGSERAAEEGVR